MGLFIGGDRARGIQAKVAKAELKRDAYSAAEDISRFGATISKGHITYGDGRIECTSSCKCEKG